MTATQTTKRRRDLIVGYVGELRKCGYPNKRLSDLSMIVDTRRFHPVELTEEQKRKYGCEVCFVSNRGKPTERVVEEDLLPLLEKDGFSKSYLMDVHDSLWELYRHGATFTTYEALTEALNKVKSFQRAFEPLSSEDQNNVVQQVFWSLNDTIYRFVALEWLDDLGVDLHLHGTNWSSHPRFAKYDQSAIPHGEELSITYQAAHFCLHLNPMEGIHQRLFEIIASGGTPLTRCESKNKLTTPPLGAALRKIAATIFAADNSSHAFNEEEQAALNDLALSFSESILHQRPQLSLQELKSEAESQLRKRLMGHPDWLLENWRDLNFQSHDDLVEILSRSRIREKFND